MTSSTPPGIVKLQLERSIWERVFLVAPLVVVGTREEDGQYDLAPKHMAMPLGWGSYFGFVCTPAHRTYWNVKREGVFTVSYPRPGQVVLASMAASPRCGEEGDKPGLRAIPTFPATRVDGVHMLDAYLFLECELDRVVDGFGDYGLIVGEVVAARVREDSLRLRERDDQDLINEQPLLAYLCPGRYSRIRRSNSFPFHAPAE